MSDEKKGSDKKSGNGNGQQRYPGLITDDLEPDPDQPDRYFYKGTDAVAEIRPRFTFYNGLLKKVTSVKWLVTNFLEQDSFGVIFGDSGTYKSFLALDICMSVATGRTWHGNAVKQGPVVYICGEGHSGVGRRLMAWREHNKFPRGKEAPLMVSHGSIDLLDPEQVVATKSVIDEMLDIPPVLIVVDTLSRNFGAGNENSTEDMTRFVNNCNGLLRAPYNACLIAVHHVGQKDKTRARGSIVLRASSDFEYATQRIDDSILMINSKMKDGPDPYPIMFDTIEVDLPVIGENGQSLNSLALDLSNEEIPTKPKRQRKLGPNQKIALRLLDTLIENDSDSRAHMENWSAAIKAEGVDIHRWTQLWKGLRKKRIIHVPGDGYAYKGIDWRLE